MEHEKKYYLVRRSGSDIKTFCGTIRKDPAVPLFYPEGKDYSYGFCPDHVFESEKTANAFAEKLFERQQELEPSYLKDSILSDDSAFAKLSEMKKYIDSQLSAFAGYVPVSFCDVHASGIQIRGTNTSVEGYYMVQVTVPYSFCGYMEKAQEFVNEYKAYYGNKDCVDFAKDFIANGKKYGWD